MAGVKHSFSVALADNTSAAAAGQVLPSHWNAEHVLSGVAEQSALDVVSNTLSALIGRVSANSGTGGAASVTSNELSAVSAAAASADATLVAAINVVSNALSVETADRVSAVNVVSAAAANALSKADAVSNAVSVVSQAVSALSNANSVDHASIRGLIATNSAQMTSAANAISAVAADALSKANAASNAASVVSAAQAVTSADLTSAKNRLSALSAQVTSADNAISNAVSIVSAAQAATSAAAAAVSAAHTSLVSDVGRISQNVSVVSVAAENALSKADAVSNRLSTWTLDNLLNVSAPSPTSTQVLKYNSAAAQWVASADATGGGGASVTSAEYQSLVDRVSANSGTGGGGSVTSNELSVAAAGLSVRIDTASNAASIVSVAAADALSKANAASNAASVVSVAAADALSKANAVSNAVSVVSNAVSALSNQNSVDHASIRNLVSIVSVAAADALSKANAVSNNLSGWTVSDLADTSLNAITSGQIMKWNATAGKWIPANDDAGGLVSVTSAEYLSLVDRVSANSGAGGGGSVTSTELSAVSANAASARSVASAAAASNLAVRAPWLGAQYRILSNNKSVTASALADISGLVLTVAAGETWEVEGQAYFSTSATTVGLRFGASVPPLALPRYTGIWRTSGAQSAGVIGGGGLIQVSGSSVLASVAGVGPTAAPFPVDFKFVFNVASAGTFRLQYGIIASGTASPMHILAGSYFKAFRIK